MYGYGYSTWAFLAVERITPGSHPLAGDRARVSRRRARLLANPSRAIYGTIVATALIAATSAHDSDPARLAAAVVLTLLVFWLAHVYAQVLEHGLRQRHLHAHLVRSTMSEEFAMVEAPGLSVVILLIGAAGWIGPQLAVNLALANGIVQLTLWGVAVARQLGRTWPVAVVAGLVNAGFGIVVVTLKALLHLSGAVLNNAWNADGFRPAVRARRFRGPSGTTRRARGAGDGVLRSRRQPRSDKRGAVDRPRLAGAPGRRLRLGRGLAGGSRHRTPVTRAGQCRRAPGGTRGGTAGTRRAGRRLRRAVGPRDGRRRGRRRRAGTRRARLGRRRVGPGEALAEVPGHRPIPVLLRHHAGEPGCTRGGTARVGRRVAYRGRRRVADARAGHRRSRTPGTPGRARRTGPRLAGRPRNADPASPARGHRPGRAYSRPDDPHPRMEGRPRHRKLASGVGEGRRPGRAGGDTGGPRRIRRRRGDAPAVAGTRCRRS